MKYVALPYVLEFNDNEQEAEGLLLLYRSLRGLWPTVRNDDG